MCLACAVAEGKSYAKNEKQIDYSSDKEYHGVAY